MRLPDSQQSYLRYPLNELLGTSGSVRVLRELTRHGGELGVGVLARRTGLNPQTVRNTLAALRRTGVVEAVGQGRSVSYRVVAQHPLVSLLTRFFVEEEARVGLIFGRLREEALRMKPRPLAVWVYGSVARGEDTPESDLDVALVAGGDDADGAVAQYRERLAALEEQQRMTISVVGLRPSDVERRSAGDPWWENVATDAVPILGPDPAALLSGIRARKRALVTGGRRGGDGDA